MNKRVVMVVAVLFSVGWTGLAAQARHFPAPIVFDTPAADPAERLYEIQ